MASRQEEKEQRRLERIQQEEAERKAAARRRRIQMVFGGLLAALVIAGGVFALTQAGGDEGGDGDGGAKPPAAEPQVNLPPPEITDVEEAAKAAGCELTHPEYEGAGHAEKEFTPADYKTNPQTSGEHFPQWADDGIYESGDTPPLGQLVHTLEHGRVNVQYKPGTGTEIVDKLEAFLSEKTGYHLLLYENATGMEAQVAATAWTHMLTCNEVKEPQIWDALRTFYDSYVDKGPEQVP